MTTITINDREFDLELVDSDLDTLRDCLETKVGYQPGKTEARIKLLEGVRAWLVSKDENYVPETPVNIEFKPGGRVERVIPVRPGTNYEIQLGPNGGGSFKEITSR